MESFQKNYEAYKTNLEKIDGMFVDPKNPVEFIEFLEKVASENKIKSDISLMQALVKENKSGPSFLAFQITCEGNFSDVIRFSEKLENGIYLIDIQNLMVKKAEASAGKVKATFLLNAVAR